MPNIMKTSKFPVKIFSFKETVAERCSVKKVFLEISQNSQENTCARVTFSIKLRPATGIFLQIVAASRKG